MVDCAIAERDLADHEEPHTYRPDRSRTCAALDSGDGRNAVPSLGCVDVRVELGRKRQRLLEDSAVRLSVRSGLHGHRSLSLRRRSDCAAPAQPRVTRETTFGDMETCAKT